MNESLNSRDEMESEVAEEARRRHHARGLDLLTEDRSDRGVIVFRYRTKRSFVPEAIIEEIGRRAGLGSAGAVRMTMVTHSYWEKGVHHFSWLY